MNNYITIRSGKNREQLPEHIKEVLENSNIFYSESYTKYLTKGKSSVNYLYSDNFVLLVVIHSKFIFRYASLPVEHISLNEEGLEPATHFLESCMKYLRKVLHVQWTMPTNASALFLAYPSNSKRIPFGSHVINLCLDEESLWKNLHSKHRNSIRKAEKSGIEIRFGGLDLINDYLIIDSQTWERSGKTGTSRKVFTDMLDSLSNNTLICMAYKDNIPQGGAFFLFNKVMSYYLFGATKNRPESGSMNLLHWKTILFMKSMSVKKYSFVGCRINEDKNSKYHEIQRFKERFGGDLIVGNMFKVTNKQLYYYLFKLLVKLKGRKIHEDAIDQEIHKWTEIHK